MSTETETNTTPESEVVIDPMVRQLSSMAELLETLQRTSKALTAEMKALTKDVNKMRLSTGRTKKPKRVLDPDAPRKLGALEKPVPITDELREFLNLEKGTLYSRQSITQGINKFVKDNDLQNPENRRFILLESEAGLRLKHLLRDPDQPLTFFNIQRYLKVHYPPKENEASEESKPSENKDVVPDAAVVEESASTEPKKKVVRKVVRKAATTPVVEVTA